MPNHTSKSALDYTRHVKQRSRIRMKPHVFGDLEELHRALRDSSVAAALQEFIARKESSLPEIVKASVSGNTFRAFHFKRHALQTRPSDLYRSWVSQRFKNDWDAIYQMSSFDEMANYVVRTAIALDNHWHRRTNVTAVRIGFGRAAKLLNLSLKHLLWSPALSTTRKTEFLRILNVPLDSYSLQAIRLVAPELKIKASSTMRFVTDERHYRKIQSGIHDLLPSGIWPIHYEIVAWNMAHSVTD